MKLLFIGLGSIGKRHLKLIQDHFLEKGDFPVQEIYALRHNPVDYSKNHKYLYSFPSSEFSPDKISFYHRSVTQIFEWQTVDEYGPFDVAFICNPTHLHLETAIRCAERGMHIFMEKPVSTSSDRLDGFLDLLSRQKLSCYIAYPFRHHHGILRFKKELGEKNIRNPFIKCHTNLANWHNGNPAEYSMRRETGGGALLELSHEIDLASFLFGEIVDLYLSSMRKNSDVTIDCEDSVYLFAEHANGDFSTIDLNIAADKEERKIHYEYKRIYGERVTFYYEPTDLMYLEQLKWFFANIGTSAMQDDFIQKVESFRKIEQIRNAKTF